MDHSEFAASIFDKYAESYEQRFMDVSMYAESFDFFCEHLDKPQASVLEIACGPGNVTKCLLDKRADLHILGTDLAPKMLEIAQKNNPSAEFQLMDARKIKSLNRKFDAIVVGFCFPYLSKEEVAQLIADAAHVLQDNGLLYISTMEDDYEKSGLVKGSQGDEIMMHFYTEEILTQVLHENHFKVIYCNRVTTTMTNGAIVVDLVLIAKRLSSLLPEKE